MSEARPLARPTKIFLGAFIVFLAIIAVGTIRLAFYGDQQKNEKQTAQAGQAAEQADKKDLAAEVKKVCDAGGAPAAKLIQAGLCGKAKEIIQEPTKVVEPGLSEAQVKAIVESEISRRNLTLTPEQVNTVATVAASKVPKPKDGKTPTTAQITPLVSAAVATFCANGACVGKDGADAPAVTAEQLAATLAAYCEPRNDCIGKSGNDGEDGIGVQSVETKDLVADGKVIGTTVTFTLTNGSEKSFPVLNGKDSTVPGPAGPAGPTCPEGSTLQKQQVLTTEAPTGLWILACVLKDQNP